LHPLEGSRFLNWSQTRSFRACDVTEEEMFTYILLPRDAMRIARSLLSSGVCPSVALVHCIHTAETIIKLLSRPGSSIILAFLTPSAYSIPRGTASVGRKIHGAGKILLLSTEIAVFPVSMER